MPQERHALEQESSNEASQRKIEDRGSRICKSREGIPEVAQAEQRAGGQQEKKECASVHQGWGEDTLAYDERRQRKEEKTSSGNLRSRSEPEAAADGDEGVSAHIQEINVMHAQVHTAAAKGNKYSVSEIDEKGFLKWLKRNSEG